MPPSDATANVVLSLLLQALPFQLPRSVFHVFEECVRKMQQDDPNDLRFLLWQNRRHLFPLRKVLIDSSIAVTTDFSISIFSIILVKILLKLEKLSLRLMTEF